MNYDDIIEALLMDTYPLMPSSGTAPFTTLVLEPAELIDFPIGALLVSTKQILMAIRVDFNRSGLIDYLNHSNI